MYLFDIVIMVLISAIFYIILINRLEYINMAKDFWGNTFKKVKVEKHVEMEPATFSIKETQEPITIPVKYLSDEKVAQEPKVVYKSAYRIRKNNEVKSNVRHNTYLMNIRKPPPKK